MQFSDFMYGMNYETFFSIIDKMYDEVLIYDRNSNIVYINQAACRHYGCRPEQMIGRSFFGFVRDEWWGPSILPVVIKEKKAYAIRQNTQMGAELLTIAVPLFDQAGELEFVVMNVRDNVNEIDLYNPQYISTQPPKDPVFPPVERSPEMQKVMRLLEKVAPLNASCLFTGEPGTGKTALARHLHSLSRRRDQSFTVFDCSGLPAEQMEASLFGTAGNPGLLEQLSGGTLLLENVCALTLETQYRLLQYLKETGRTSGNEDEKVRILASTDKDLRALTIGGQFREELYYLLNVVEIYVPPLRKRRQDIPSIIYQYVTFFCTKYGVNRQFTDGAIQVLVNSDWPGNIRELQHTIERLIVMVDSLVIDVNQLPKSLFGIVDPEGSSLYAEGLSEDENFEQRMARFEASLIRDAYQKYGTSRRIAKHLGISQTKANNLIRKHITDRTEE